MQECVPAPIGARHPTAACGTDQPSGILTAADANESDAEGSVREGPPVLDPLHLISSSTIHKTATCARQPCRRDLSSHVNPQTIRGEGVQEGGGSRSTGSRKQPQCAEHGCFRYGNYHRCGIVPLGSRSCISLVQGPQELFGAGTTGIA